jgi:hypothetical protein
MNAGPVREGIDARGLRRTVDMLDVEAAQGPHRLSAINREAVVFVAPDGAGGIGLTRRRRRRRGRSGRTAAHEHDERECRRAR